jgi:hypothetical protein
MKVGDLVELIGWESSNGIVVAKLPSDGILAPAVSILWASGELTERVAPRILEVINESR